MKVFIVFLNDGPINGFLSEDLAVKHIDELKAAIPTDLAGFPRGMYNYHYKEVEVDDTQYPVITLGEKAKNNLRPVKVRLRECIINQLKISRQDNEPVILKGYFHKWVNYADEDGSDNFALVELEDGRMIEEYTTAIEFLDRK